jgi:hypothetical protein
MWAWLTKMKWSYTLYLSTTKSKDSHLLHILLTFQLRKAIKTST